MSRGKKKRKKEATHSYADERLARDVALGEAIAAVRATSPRRALLREKESRSQSRVRITSIMNRRLAFVAKRPCSERAHRSACEMRGRGMSLEDEVAQSYDRALCAAR